MTQLYADLQESVGNLGVAIEENFGKLDPRAGLSHIRTGAGGPRSGPRRSL